MNRRLHHSITLLVSLAFLTVLVGCATQGAPSGGEKDTEGPKLVGSKPAPGTLNYDGKEIVFQFDEFLKPGSYSKEVFISPVLPVAPLVTVKNKQLRIRFRSELRANTTYVITLSTEIKDFNEGNKMEKSFTYAFSTGDQLDSLSISGQIVNAYSGQGQKEMTVLLYPEEDIAGNDIWDRRPVYATQTDESGAYKFEYLREGRYKIYAVGDKDQSFSYSQQSEALALAENPLVDLSDTTTYGKPLPLMAFVPDEEGPRVKSARWVNDHTIHVEFSEPIRTNFAGDSLAIYISDTLGQNESPVVTARYRYQDPQHIYLYSPRARELNSNLRFLNLLDTLGNATDSTLRLLPQLLDKAENGRLFDPPILLPEEKQIMLLAYFRVPETFDQALVQLRDSSGKRFSIRSSGDSYALLIDYTALPDYKMPFQLTIDSAFARHDGQLIDSTITFDLNFPNPEEYGSIRGAIRPDTLPERGQWVVFVEGKRPKYLKLAGATASPQPKGGKSKFSKGAPVPKTLYRLENADSYHFRFLPAGKYPVRYLLDEDGNGYYTPGSLDPYRLPEKFISDPVPLEIRANWEVENFDLFPGFKQKAGVDDLKNKLGEDGNGSDSPEESEDESDE